MKIIKNAKIPKSVKRKCRNCGCKFEANFDDSFMTIPEVGQPYKRFVRCPFCDTTIFYSFNHKNAFHTKI